MVLAALLVAFGGVVIPVIGWIVGIALVWMSKTWLAWEKWVATLAPFAAVVADGPHHRTHPGSSNRRFPGCVERILLAILVNVIVGIWLLWRAQGRTIRER